MNYFLGHYYISDVGKPIELKVKAPIEWIPLEKKNGKTLLLSKNVLDWEMYDEDGKLWRESFLFHYLNKLYDSIFSEEEKTVIAECEYGRIFPLSVDEIKRYFPKEEDRRAIEYFVMKQGEEIIVSIEHSWYWCRYDTEFDECVPYVTALGGFDEMDAEADEIGVRVAMWVETKKARELSGKNGYNRYHHLWSAKQF